jgi:hypothetical protein
VTPAEQVALIYTVFGTVFLAGIGLAFVTTGARFLFYVRYHRPPPRLLNRDVLVKGGYALSFGLIAGIRLLPLEVRTGLNLSQNVAWALITAVPACVSAVTYCYFELAVIPRARLDEHGEIAQVPS